MKSSSFLIKIRCRIMTIFFSDSPREAYNIHSFQVIFLKGYCSVPWNCYCFKWNMPPLIKWNKSCCIHCIYISLDLQLMMSPPLTWTAQVLFCFQKSTQTQDLDTKLAQKFSFHLIQMINFHVQHTTDLCMWNRRASHYNVIKFMSIFQTFFPNQILNDRFVIWNVHIFC